MLRSILAEAPGLHHDPDEAAEHVLAAMAELPLHPDVAPGLAHLHTSGIRLAALTNGSTRTARRLLENAGVADCIEEFLSVEAVRRWKPAPEAYRFAAEACGVSPQQMMLAAVHPWDIDGAKRAGLAAAWINRSGAAYPGYLSAADLRCPSFIALADALVAKPRS